MTGSTLLRAASTFARGGLGLAAVHAAVQRRCAAHADVLGSAREDVAAEALALYVSDALRPVLFQLLPPADALAVLHDPEALAGLAFALAAERATRRDWLSAWLEEHNAARGS